LYQAAVARRQFGRPVGRPLLDSLMIDIVLDGRHFRICASRYTGSDNTENCPFDRVVDA
jgi:transposase